MEQQESTNEIITEPEVKPKQAKKKHKLLKTLGIIIVILAIITIILGFIFPGLLWTKDLGVRYTEADYKSVLTKLSYIKDAMPTGASRDDYKYTYGQITDVSTEFTSSEITAFINTGRPSYYAVKNVQVRINNDGTIDASGTVNVDYFLSEVLSGKYSRAQIAKEVPLLGFLPGSVNLALNVEGSILNNSTSIGINSAEVQGVPIPTKYVNSTEAVSTVTGGINSMMSKYKAESGSVFTKVATENSKLILNGKFPSSLTRQKQ